jgi:hypothetical protein
MIAAMDTVISMPWAAFVQNMMLRHGFRALGVTQNWEKASAEAVSTLVIL